MEKEILLKDVISFGEDLLKNYDQMTDETKKMIINVLVETIKIEYKKQLENGL